MHEAEQTSSGSEDLNHLFVLRKSSSLNSGRQFLLRAILCVGLGLVLVITYSKIVETASQKALEDHVISLASSADVKDQSSSEESNSAHLDKKHENNVKPLSKLERKKVLEQVKDIKHKVLAEAKKASTLDKEVGEAINDLKTQTVHAKSLRQDGDDYESSARKKVLRAAADRKLAEKYRRDSEVAKRKFVTAEKPIELAMKLESHDQRSYRKIQLAIAEHVTLLSENPDDKKMRALVHKLVDSSKSEKKSLEEDKKILQTLQARTADASLSGSQGYAALREKSVKVAKEAEQLAEGAVSLAKKGHKDRVSASKIVVKEEKALKDPEALAAQAEAERAKYVPQLALLAKLQAELAVRTPKPAHKDKMGDNLAANSETHHSKGHDYDRDRRELEKVVNDGDDDTHDENSHGRHNDDSNHKERGDDSDDDSHTRARLHRRERHEDDSDNGSGDEGSRRAKGGEGKTVETAAEDDYSRIEREAMRKEERRAARHRQHSQHHSSRSSDDDDNDDSQQSAKDSLSDDSSSDDSSSTESAAARRAHVMSSKQSTFLMGLFSDKAPWDTDHDRAR